MKCPQCQADLPESARFCGACGHRFPAGADPGFGEMKTDAQARPVRFFADSSEPTDPAKAKRLLELANKHASTHPPATSAPPPPAPHPLPAPPPGRSPAATVAWIPAYSDPLAGGPTIPSMPAYPGNLAPAPEPPAPSPAPATAPTPTPTPAPAAPATPEPPATVETPPPAQAAPPPAAAPAPTRPQPSPAFQFEAADLSRALAQAAFEQGVSPPLEPPADLEGFYAAGEKLGVTRKALELALHQVALERLKPPAPAHPAMTAPTTMELLPIQPSKTKILVVTASVVAVLVLGGILLLKGDGAAPGQPGVEGASSGGAAVAPGEEKPKRKIGQLDPKKIQAAIAAVGEKARPCHEAARKKQPKLAGHMVLDMEVEEDGTITRLEVKEDSLKDAVMVECVKSHVKAFEWPRPQGGYLGMEFPLHFQVAVDKGEPKKGRKKGK